MSVVQYTPPHRDEWVELMAPTAELAKVIANTDFVPKSLRGNPAAITACVFYGREVGLGPMQSLALIAVVDGRPTLYAEAMRALILAAGHDFWVEEATITRVTVAGRRRESDQTVRATWTMDDAKRAGIAGKDNWRKYPRAMLMARATAELARSVFADAIGGLRATEEVDDGEVAGEAAAPVAATTTRRRRRPALAAAPPVEGEPPPLPGDEESATESGSPQSVTPSGLGDVPDGSDATSAGGNGPGDMARTSPEPPPAELITEPQLRKMMALFRERGFGDENREARLAFATVVIGHPITTSLDLTVEEASKVIDALEHGHDAAPPDA